MNTMLIPSPMPALLVQLPAGQHRVYHRWRRRDHAGGEPRISFAEGKELAGSRPGGTLNIDIGMRVHLARSKSP